MFNPTEVTVLSNGITVATQATSSPTASFQVWIESGIEGIDTNLVYIAKASPERQFEKSAMVEVTSMALAEALVKKRYKELHFGTPLNVSIHQKPDFKYKLLSGDFSTEERLNKDLILAAKLIRHLEVERGMAIFKGFLDASLESHSNLRFSICLDRI